MFKRLLHIPPKRAPLEDPTLQGSFASHAARLPPARAFGRSRRARAATRPVVYDTTQSYRALAGSRISTIDVTDPAAAASSAAQASSLVSYERPTLPPQKGFCSIIREQRHNRESGSLTEMTLPRPTVRLPPRLIAFAGSLHSLNAGWFRHRRARGPGSPDVAPPRKPLHMAKKTSVRPGRSQRGLGVNGFPEPKPLPFSFAWHEAARYGLSE
jgi:hypothetical protein